MRNLSSKALVVGGVAAWLATVGLGFALLAWHEIQPGLASAAPSQWPAASNIERADGQFTIVTFMHPHCPCSVASLEELEMLVSQCAGRARICVVFYRPADAEPGWEESSLFRRAGELPGVRVICDRGEIERQRFGVLTSGQTLVYDAAGQLRFCGGLTRARGMAGESASREAVARLLRGDSTDELTQASVFGCSLVAGGGTIGVAYDSRRAGDRQTLECPAP